MVRTLVEEIHIPKEHAMAFKVSTGQIMRVIEIEGLQCADIAMFNAHNYQERYDPQISYTLNSLQGTGNTKTIKYMYSRPPRMNLMFTVVEDTVRSHWCLWGGRCNTRIYEIKGVMGYHRNCQDSLAEAIAPFGLTEYDVPDVFNAFMDVEYPPDGRYRIKAAPAKKGDYIDLLAHMDCLVAVSACPNEDTPVNGGVPKPLKVEIWQEES